VGYSAVKGGLEAISVAERLIQHPPLAPDETALDTRHLEHQLALAVDKIMSEGGLYAPELAALALKQAEGDLFEAAFLLRAYRSTLPRFGYSLPTRGDRMRVIRRISSAFKDVPGGQLLGRTRDYTQRLLDFSLLGAGAARNGNGTNGKPHPRPLPIAMERGEQANDSANGHQHIVEDENESSHHVPLSRAQGEGPGVRVSFPKVADTMRAAGLIAPLADLDPSAEPPDVTIDAVRYPAPRTARLQMLARGESGAMLSFAYASLRAFGGGDHGTVAELRVGDLPLQVMHPLLGQAVTIGHYRATEAELLGPDRDEHVPGKVHAGYSLSYGLVFGQHERKAISMAVLDSTLMATEGQERPRGSWSPAGDQEMVLSHIDPIESSGFVEHLKLPHYVTFGSSLQGTLAMQAEKNRLAPSPGDAGARDDDHQGIGAGQLHHHGDGVLHAHDD
jgi:alpha-D-ribose 1-methylphosphonate 5-triphosphate synthase subunit PhnI